MDKIKVKIVAVSSNEAYFLPQWIYHHFYFGFDAIDIFVNRSSDNTLEILDKLKRQYPAITVYDFDFIDLIPGFTRELGGMQYGAYMFAYYNTCRDFDYVLFIDIDEFWMSKNCEDKIQDCIINLNYPDVVAFQWFNTGGQPEYVMPLLAQKEFKGHLSPYAKCMVKTRLKPKLIPCHIPAFDQVTNFIMADGMMMEPDKSDSEKISIIHLKDIKEYFVLHDHMRSSIPYIAKIPRGRATKPKCVSISSMPIGRMLYYSFAKPFEMVKFINKIPHHYLLTFYGLFNSLHLYDDLIIAKIHQIHFALDACRIIYENKEHDFSKNLILTLGDISVFHDFLISQLIILDQAYEELDNVSILTLNELFSKNLENTKKLLYIAVKMYPYAVDKDYHPLFLKSLIIFLLNNDFIQEAKDILSDLSNESVEYFGIAWAYELFAKKYEEDGKYDEALKWYSRLKYSKNRNVLNKIQTLNKIC